MMAFYPIKDLYAPVCLSDIAKDARYANFTQAVLNADPAARRLISNTENDKAAFLSFAENLHHSIGSPIAGYIRAILSDIFSTDAVLSPSTAEEIWHHTEAMLQSPAFSCREILQKCGVRSISVPMDPLDDLRQLRMVSMNDGQGDTHIHPVLDASSFFGPASSGYAERISTLAAASSMSIQTVEDLLGALDLQMDRFYAAGSRSLLIRLPRFGSRYDEKKANKALSKALSHAEIKEKDAAHFDAAFLHGLSLLCVRKNWVMHVRIHDVTMSGRDVANLFDQFALLRAHNMLPRVIIGCRCAAQLSVVSMLLNEADIKIQNLVFPLLSAELGADELIVQASTLARHSLLHRCMGYASGISSILGFAMQKEAQKKLAAFLVSISDKERASCLMHRLCGE